MQINAQTPIDYTRRLLCKHTDYCTDSHILLHRLRLLLRFTQTRTDYCTGSHRLLHRLAFLKQVNKLSWVYILHMHTHLFSSHFLGMLTNWVESRLKLKQNVYLLCTHTRTFFRRANKLSWLDYSRSKTCTYYTCIQPQTFQASQQTVE